MSFSIHLPPRADPDMTFTVDWALKPNDYLSILGQQIRACVPAAHLVELRAEVGDVVVHLLQVLLLLVLVHLPC